MSVPGSLSPRRLVRSLDAIDREWLDPAATGWRGPAAVLLVAAVCLLGIHYLKYHDVFRAGVRFLADPDAAHILLHGTWSPLLVELWWGVVHLAGYVLVPALYLRFIVGREVADFGLRWAQTSRWLGWYAGLAALIVAFAFVASRSDAFTATYPFYRHAARSWADLLGWECIYLAQFLFLEFFFRGFLLKTLAPGLGAVSIFVMAVPYTMIHFAKPWPEALGAVLFGILLGMLALRSRSIWGGFMTHATIALSMDLLGLWRTDGWPSQWWPG